MDTKSKSNAVAIGLSFRHSREQDVDSDISWTLGSQSVEVKHAHLCMPCVGPSGLLVLWYFVDSNANVTTSTDIP